jgi:hypothetical protein
MVGLVRETESFLIFGTIQSALCYSSSLLPGALPYDFPGGKGGTRASGFPLFYSLPRNSYFLYKALC